MIVKEISQITSDDITRYICEKATQKEVGLFLNICRANGLNPFKREAYLVKYKDDQPATILTGYEVYLKRAERSGQYAGFKVWIENKAELETMTACIDVYRKDWVNPLHHEVSFREYAQYKTDFQTKKKVLNRFWQEKPETMLKKVVISQAFRWAFPDDVGGLPYTEAEIVNNDQQVDIIPSKPFVEAPKAISEPVKPTQQSFRVITEAEGKSLLAIVVKNGYTKEDLKSFAESLGYQRAKELNEEDFEDAIAYFNVPRTERKAKEEDLDGETWEDLEKKLESTAKK